MSVTVSTPSRLHFGLLRFEQAEGPSFGGLGMMIASPRTTVRVRPSTEWIARGPDSVRALADAKRALDHLRSRPTESNLSAISALAADVVEAIPSHQGLGSGSQLALAIAAATRRICRLPEPSAEELALDAGRGRRSAIGCHGFLRGGLLYELGTHPRESLGRLARRANVPDAWRIILVTASSSGGLSGERESAAFQRLPPVPTATTERLQQLATDFILPAAERDDVESFGDALFEYGRLAGECFASVQGGPYASAEIADCVQSLHETGGRGVGQSSWGPTVFGFARDQAHAEEIVARMRASAKWRDHAIRITHADNRGAHIATPI